MSYYKLTPKEQKKLQKALELVNKASELINQVQETNDKIKYDANANSLYSRVSGTISILEQYV